MNKGIKIMVTDDKPKGTHIDDENYKVIIIGENKCDDGIIRAIKEINKEVEVVYWVDEFDTFEEDSFKKLDSFVKDIKMFDEEDSKCRKSYDKFLPKPIGKQRRKK